MIYKNPFHIPKSDNSQPEYTAHNWIEYKGYKIIERIKGSVWDVVYKGEIVCMRAGLNGAKKYIDNEKGDIPQLIDASYGSRRIP